MKPFPFTCRSDCVEHLKPFGIPSDMILTPKTTLSLLLIACTNLANLAIKRSIAKISVRY